MTGFVVEPIIQLIEAPYGDNPASVLHLDDAAAGVLNGDSSDFQLDETNIFSFNRLPDTIWSKAVHARISACAPKHYSLPALSSFSWARPTVPNPIRFLSRHIACRSGYSGVTSDLVSRLTVNFAPHLSMSDRIDMNSSTGTLDRNEVNVDANYGRFLARGRLSAGSAE